MSQTFTSEKQPVDDSFTGRLGRSFNNYISSPRGTLGASPAYQLGRAVGPYVKPKLRGLIKNFDSSPLNAGLMGSGLGAGLGGLISLIRGGNPISGALTGGLSGGLALMLLRALSGYATNEKNLGFGNKYIGDTFKNPINLFKSASVYGSGGGRTADILNNIYRSPIPPQIMSSLAGDVNRLNARQTNKLKSLLAGATGATAAFIIAKFLFNMGIKTSAVMAILGGLMGRSSNALRSLF